jgi:hypothetical protein
MDIREELKSAGVYPTGPVSAWPEERNKKLHSLMFGDEPPRKINASMGKMSKNLAKTAGQAIRNGRVTKEIRDERYDTCNSCEFFVKETKRCSECGCYMEAKTWVGGNPDGLCPKKKWAR